MLNRRTFLSGIAGLTATKFAPARPNILYRRSAPHSTSWEAGNSLVRK